MPTVGPFGDVAACSSLNLVYPANQSGSHFLVHFTTTDPDHSVPNVDTLTSNLTPRSGGDGVPDFVQRVYEAAETVYRYYHEELGYPNTSSSDTPTDVINPDERCDIYLYDWRGWRLFPEMGRHQQRWRDVRQRNLFYPPGYSGRDQVSPTDHLALADFGFSPPT